MLYPVHLAMNEVEHTTLVVIGSDCIGSCKSNYHTITATTAPQYLLTLKCIQLHQNILHYLLTFSVIVPGESHCRNCTILDVYMLITFNVSTAQLL